MNMKTFNMKTFILLSALAASSCFAQSSGVISNPFNTEVMGGNYYPTGTATASMGNTIPATVGTIANLTNGNPVITITGSTTGLFAGQLAFATISGNGVILGKVLSVVGASVTLSSNAPSSNTGLGVFFANVYLNADGGPGCIYCSISSGSGSSTVIWTGTIEAGLGGWPMTTHTLSLTVVDSAGSASTTSPISVTVYNSSPAGNCSATAISGSIICEEAATSATSGPSATVTFAGPFAAGDVLHTSAFLLRPASPATNLNGALTATQTSVAINAPATYTGTLSATAASTTAAVDPTSFGGVCGTRLGEVLTASQGIAGGTAVINCLGSNLSATPHFQSAIAATAAGTANTRVLMIGDSITRGYPYQVNQVYPALTQITNNLPNSPGIANYGSFGSGSSDNRWTIGSGWSVISGYVGFAHDGGFTATSGASPLVFTPGTAVFDTFKVYYATQTGFGTFAVQATGGSSTTIPTPSGSGRISTVTVTAGSAGTGNAVTISSPSGTAYILAVEPSLSTAKQVYIGNVGIGGTEAYDWSQNTGSGYSSIQTIEAVVPDLCVINLGANDAAAMVTTANYISSMTPIIAACKASGDVIIMTFWPSQNTTVATYEAMYYPSLLALAASNSAPVIDLWGQFGGVNQPALSYDTLHPNSAGYQVIANDATTVITNDQITLSQAAVATSFAQTNVLAANISMQYTFPSPTGIGAATVGSSGGSGYVHGDILNVTGGGGTNGQVLVTSVSGSAVTGVIPIAALPANFYTSTGYSNTSNASTTAYTGSGSGATVNITAGFLATIADTNAGPGFEQWLVTGVSGVNWTVTRGFNGTQPIAHGGGTIGAYDRGPYPSLPTSMVDSAGNKWYLIQVVPTTYQDSNAVDSPSYYTTFTSGTAAAANAAMQDVITYTSPYSDLGLVAMNATRYRGLGSIGNNSKGAPTNGFGFPGGTFNSSMNANRFYSSSDGTGTGWPVSPGDLCIVDANGLGFMILGSSSGPTPNPLLYPHGGSGMVSVTGNVVTLLSGTQFGGYPYSSQVPTPFNPGSPIILGGSTYYIASVTDTSHLVTITTPPASGSEAYSVPDSGSPISPATGWTLRAAGERLYTLDAIATGSTCNGGALATNIDGVGTMGVAFHPASSGVAYGQSSVIASSNYLFNASVPAVSASGGVAALEFEIDTITNTVTDTLFDGSNNLGLYMQLLPTGTPGKFQFYAYNERLAGHVNPTDPCGGNAFLPTISPASIARSYPIWGRYQVSYGTTPPTDSFELWDGTGERLFGRYCTYSTTSGSNSNGMKIGAMNTGDQANIGFLWERSTVLPLNSKMPTFAHNGSPNCVFDWHFDTSTGTTVDSCGVGSYPASSSGTTTYVNTPTAVQQVIVAKPVQAGNDLNSAPIATSAFGWETMNSASPGTQQMDCLAQSVTQYNGNDSLSGGCSWSVSQYPAGHAPTLSGATANQPTLSSLYPTNTATNVDYILSLTVTDGFGQTSSAGTIEMGAAPLDANGVITNMPTNVSQFFGPLMSYGRIPWGETDYLQRYMIDAQTTYQAQPPANGSYSQYAIPPTAGGTISFPFTAKGEGFGIAGTTTTGNITGAQLTIPIADITKISTPFPTWIMLIGSGFEIVRVTGCTSTCPGSGPATLQVAYDGRGLSSNSTASITPIAAFAWPSGTTVGEMRVQGTSTLFATDATRPLAQSGVPGPLGCTTTCPTPPSSPGTAVLTPSSPTMSGSGTGWTSAVVGDNVRIAATHSSGMSFIFWREITGWTDATHVTLDHAAPSDVDRTSFNYTLSIPQYVSLQFPAPQDNHTINLIFPIFGCESETACFSVGAHDIPQLDASTISGLSYSWQSYLGAAGAFGPNFYGTDLALWNFYWRSGYTPALTLAKSISEKWSHSPEVGDYYAGGDNLLIGGGAIGGFADLLSNSSTSLTAATFEQMGLALPFPTLLIATTFAPASCNTQDSRDSGIAADAVTMLANWDSNTGTGTLSGGVGVNSTGGTITGWTGGGNYLTPPFVALLTDGSTTFEFVRVTGITGTSFTWTPSYYISGGATTTHANGSTLYMGAAMYTFILSKLDERDQKCRRNASDGYTGAEVNSFAQTSNYFSEYGPVTLITNSTAGSPTTGSINPAMCNGQDTGTLTISAGSYSAVLSTGTVGLPSVFPPMNQRIYIWDGTSFLAAYAYIASAYGTTGATLTLTGAWPAGNSNCAATPCTYMTSNSGLLTAIWNVNDDSFAANERLKLAWECIYNSPTSITLNRPWDEATNTNYYSASYASEGLYQQGFMPLGYKTTGMRWAQHSSNPTVASDYTTMAQQLGTWGRNYAWDPVNTKGIFYVSVFGGPGVCGDPSVVFNPALFSHALVSTLHGGDGGNIQGCGAAGSNTPNGGADAVARSQIPEAGSGMVQWFNTNPSGNKSTMDTFYGAAFGVGQPYGANAGCAASVSSTCDGIDAINCEIGGMGSYKWPGFCFGLGGFFSTSYPAVRTSIQLFYSPVSISGRGITAGPGFAP